MGEGKLATTNQPASDVVHNAICFPFISIMRALNRTKVDYFSLDVEGFEMPILKTIPFDQIDISVFTIEYSHMKDPNEVVRFMEEKGYKKHAELHARKPEIYYGCDDFVFVKND